MVEKKVSSGPRHNEAHMRWSSPCHFDLLCLRLDNSLY